MCLAVPGQVISIGAESDLLRTGVVDFSGVRRTVNLGFIEDVAVGDFVLIHAGVALSTVSPAEAEMIMSELAALAEENGPCEIL